MATDRQDRDAKTASIALSNAICGIDCSLRYLPRDGPGAAEDLTALRELRTVMTRLHDRWCEAFCKAHGVEWVRPDDWPR